MTLGTLQVWTCAEPVQTGADCSELMRGAAGGVLEADRAGIGVGPDIGDRHQPAAGVAVGPHIDRRHAARARLGDLDVGVRLRREARRIGDRDRRAAEIVARKEVERSAQRALDVGLVGQRAERRAGVLLDVRRHKEAGRPARRRVDRRHREIAGQHRAGLCARPGADDGRRRIDAERVGHLDRAREQSWPGVLDTSRRRCRASPRRRRGRSAAPPPW